MTVSDQSASPVGVGLPLIGDRAPDFEAESTHGPVRLADYAGRWLVLFSHPADFTPYVPRPSASTSPGNEPPSRRGAI